MKSKLIKAMPILVAAIAVGFVCFLQALPVLFPATAGAQIVRRLKWIAYDARVRAAARYYDDSSAATNLAGVFLDDVAITRMNDGSVRYGTFRPRVMFPWPRYIHGRILRELTAQGAAAVGYDILFSELWEPSPETNVRISETEIISSDEFFAKQIWSAGNVVLATDGEVLPAVMFRTNSWSLGSIRSHTDEDGILRRAKAFTYCTNQVWHPQIEIMSRAVDFDLRFPEFRKNEIYFPIKTGGRHSIDLKPDGSLDFEQFAEDPPETPQPPFSPEVIRVWHLGIVMAARALGIDLDKALIEDDRIVLNGGNGVERIIPLDRDGYFYIDWVLTWEKINSGVSPVLAGGAVFSLLMQDEARWTQGETDLNEPFKGKLVVVGSVGTGRNIGDQGPTPLERASMLVTKHLNVANSILTGRFIREYSYGTELLMILLMGVISALITWRTRVLFAGFSLIGLAGLYTTAAFVLYIEHRYVAPLILPVAGGLLLPHFSMVTYRVIFEQREQRRVKGVFSKIVSPNVVNELLSAERLSLGGARRNVTVFFADVRGFTQMTDDYQAKAEDYVREQKLDPAAAEVHFDMQAQETLRTVNLYLSAIADKVKEHEGTLDKYMGDCVMAFWGAPTPNEKHALSCVRAAIDAQRAMYVLNQNRFAENKRREEENKVRVAAGESPLAMLSLLSLGTGINTGIVTVGLMGSDEHILNYTVFGREVNLASRLEGVSGRGRIIISESTYQELLRDDPVLAATCLAQPPVTVKGIKQAVKIFEVPWKEKPAPIAPEASPAAQGAAATAAVTPQPSAPPSAPGVGV